MTRLVDFFLLGGVGGPPEVWSRGEAVTKAIYRDRRWQVVRRLVLVRDGFRCRVAFPHRCAGLATAVDHVVELEDGGAPFDPSNLQAACRAGNTAKRNAAVAARARRAGGDPNVFRTTRRW